MRMLKYFGVLILRLFLFLFPWLLFCGIMESAQKAGMHLAYIMVIGWFVINLLMSVVNDITESLLIKANGDEE